MNTLSTENKIEMFEKLHKTKTNIESIQREIMNLQLSQVNEAMIFFIHHGGLKSVSYNTANEFTQNFTNLVMEFISEFGIPIADEIEILKTKLEYEKEQMAKDKKTTRRTKITKEK